MANGNKCIFDTLRSNSAFLRMRKYDLQTEASIGFFLGINPKLTLRKALKEKKSMTLLLGLTSTMMTPNF